MKRLHLHVSVPDLEPAIAFYSTLFDASPSVVKDDYAKWMLEDPRVNLAISSRARSAGIDHVGVQVDSASELAELAGRLKAAGATTFDQEATTCCYAQSDKSWVTDTAGVRWETFFTHGEATAYGEDEVISDTASACCAPKPAQACC
ncbi:ArsI/CadI family heavy metal resistance metalloenzyme [Sphingomonas sp. MS122]|uniref:ArsI/CadI family heavy metal resistance metalloenzyme n=1 Tax=Sphingomonas sp. MS122 TaxID=3412683 RepID=UPI003C2FEDBB